MTREGFGTWWLFDHQQEEERNTFHWRSEAERKREDLIEAWPEHTEATLEVIGVPWVTEMSAEEYLNSLGDPGWPSGFAGGGPR